jgi:hypothetical protein
MLSNHSNYVVDFRSLEVSWVNVFSMNHLMNDDIRWLSFSYECRLPQKDWSVFVFLCF